MENSYIFMYITNIMPTTFNYITGNSFSVRVISSQYSKIEDWNIASLIAPFWRLYLPLDSGARVSFEHREFPLRPMIPMLIPPYTDFSSSCPAPFRKIFCHFDLQTNLHFSPGIFEIDLPDHLNDNFNRITRECSEAMIPLLNASLLETLAIGISSIIEDHSSISVLSTRTRKIIEYMRKNLTKPLSNQLLADTVSMAENSMVRDFKQQTGTAPQKYYMRLRLEYACELLINTSLSIEEISEKCGFWDRNHFTRYFTRLLQCPPAEFRKRNLSRV
jgi:AraC-like DNA-binding protein